MLSSTENTFIVQDTNSFEISFLMKQLEILSSVKRQCKIFVHSMSFFSGFKIKYNKINLFFKKWNFLRNIKIYSFMIIYA